MAAIDDVWRNRRDDVAPERRGARARRSTRTAQIQPAADLPGDRRRSTRRCSSWPAVRRRVGRVRRGAEVPVDDEPRARAAGPPSALRRTMRRTIVTTSLDAMASGGMYDHLGGGFARYSVDERVAGAPLREDAVRPGAAGARLPPRLAVIGERALAPGRRRDDRLRAARPAPSRRRLLLGRGRRLARRAGGHEGLFYTWTPDEVRAVLGDDADVALEWYELTDERQLRGPQRS